MDFHGFTLVHVDLHDQNRVARVCEDFCRISLTQGLGCPAACVSLRPKAVAPIEYHPQSPGLAGWQDGGWLTVWLDGCAAGRLDGWTV